MILSAGLLLSYGLFGGWNVISDVFVSYWRQLLLASPLCLVFALATLALRGATATGALAGFAVAVILRARFGTSMLATLAAVFAITWIATRIGYRRKLQAGLAAYKAGRNGMQVLANLAPAALLTILYPVEWAVSVMLAEVCADTVASEIGQAFGGRPRLITNFRRAEIGDHGAMTWLGTLSGILAAGVIIVVGNVARNLQFSEYPESVFSAFDVQLIVCAIAGMMLDSVLGATLERRRIFNNDAVNFVSASFAGMVVIARILVRIRLHI